jgi:hypothetical protein
MTRMRIRVDLVKCIDNKGYEASLERGKLYRAEPDANGEEHGLIRVIDESRESYLYPKSLFRLVSQPMAKIKAALPGTIKGRRPKRTKKAETPKRRNTAA